MLMQLSTRKKETTKTRSPSRRELLDAANKAMGKGKLKVAVGHYLRTVEHHGADPAIDAKLASIYAKLRRQTRAREHFQAASERFQTAGFQDKALAVYRAAVAAFPTRIEFWQGIVDHQRAQGRIADAVHTLLEARKSFRSAALRPQAVRLLEQVIELEPQHHPQAKVELALLMAKVGRASEARASLEALVPQSERARLRNVRAALFRLSPTPAAAWRWLRAVLLGR
jgi:tetratricopeptide (TPR) repeat protein